MTTVALDICDNCGRPRHPSRMPLPDTCWPATNRGRIACLELALDRWQAALLRAPRVQTIGIDPAPPLKQWCVLFTPDSWKPAVMAKYDGDDWDDGYGTSWSAHLGDRWLPLPTVV